MGQIFSTAARTFNVDEQYQALDTERQRYVACAQDILNKMEALRARQDELSALSGERVTELPRVERSNYQVDYKIVADTDDYELDADCIDSVTGD